MYLNNYKVTPSEIYRVNTHYKDPLMAINELHMQKE